MSLRRNSSLEEKTEVASAVFEKIMDFFFDGVVFINLAYSDLGDGGTTSTTAFGKLSRIIDSAAGRLMRPGRESRIRCQFYLLSPSKFEGYILSPAVYDAVLLPASLTDMSVFRSYVGIKIDEGSMFVAVKEANKGEVLYPINLTLEMDDVTYTKTYALEIKHNVQFTEIIINGKSYGTYATDLVGNTESVVTFYPFFAPARSTDGTLVNVVAENIQFIQSKK